ncbi:MAG: MBL fold metallo-hydrolase [Polyangiaceae bacterium]
MPRYTNLDGTTPDKGPAELLRWQWERIRDGKLKDTSGFVAPTKANDGAQLADSSPHLTWIGHATFVQRLAGKLIATDPIWSERIGTVKRLVAPGVAMESLPPLDIVTISHSHFDHLDMPTLKRLGRRPTYVVPRDVGELLRAEGLPNVVELGWWESYTSGDLTITLVPAHHWSMRMPWDRNTRLWGGFVYHTHNLTTYHSGDTGFSARMFEQIAARMPPIDYAMLPIGAYAPRWFMRDQHMDPVDAIEAFELLGAKNFVAMHWATFRLTDEPLGEPPLVLEKEWSDRGIHASRLHVPSIGEMLRLA